MKGLQMQNKLSSAIAVAVLLATSQADADIVYAVGQTVGAGTLTGSITTNGASGGIGQGDILAWDLTITSVITTNLTNLNSHFDVDGALSATDAGVFFDFSGQGYAFVFSNTGHGIVCMTASNSSNCGSLDQFSTFSLQPDWNASPDGTTFSILSGNVRIAGAGAVSAVPGPIAGAGLPGLMACAGLFGLQWRKRKRRGSVA